VFRFPALPPQPATGYLQPDRLQSNQPEQLQKIDVTFLPAAIVLFCSAGTRDNFRFFPEEMVYNLVIIDVPS